MLKLYDIVKLKKEDKKFGIKPTYIGSIVDIINNGEAYTVEFINPNGDTIEKALMTEFSENELIKID